MGIASSITKGVGDAATSIGKVLGLGTDAAKLYLLMAGGLGIGGGVTAGALSGYLRRNSNDKLVTLKRKDKYYRRKTREMDNANWLNDVLAAKRKLDTARLTDEERTEIENEYKDLINRGVA